MEMEMVPNEEPEEDYRGCFCGECRHWDRMQSPPGGDEPPGGLGACRESLRMVTVPVAQHQQQSRIIGPGMLDHAPRMSLQPMLAYPQVPGNFPACSHFQRQQ
jgi:hypothetical protein